MSRSGRESLTNDRQWSGGPLKCSRSPLGCSGVVGRPTRMFERHSRMSGSVLKDLPYVSRSGRETLPDVSRPSRMSGSGRQCLSDVREWFGTPPDVREWSGESPGCTGVVGRPCRMSGSGRKACQMSGRGQKAIPNIREWSGEHAECPGMVGRPSWMSGSSQEAFLIVWK